MKIPPKTIAIIAPLVGIATVVGLILIASANGERLSDAPYPDVVMIIGGVFAAATVGAALLLMPFTVNNPKPMIIIGILAFFLAGAVWYGYETEYIYTLLSYLHIAQPIS